MIAVANGMARVEVNEIIFYRKTDDKIYFYFLLENKHYYVLFGDIDEQVSCKLIQDAIYICAFTENNNIKLKILSLIYLENGKNSPKDFKVLTTTEVDNFSNNDNVILYDTINQNYKVLCAREIINNSIKCIEIEFSITYDTNDLTFTVNYIKYYDIINSYETSYSFKEDNCNFTNYNSEYLICCGITDSIVCDIRDIDFSLLNSFSLAIEGKNRNITFEKFDGNIKLIFSNEAPSGIYIYEYYIYQPKCTNYDITINTFQTKQLNLTDLFEIKTNTKYYITITNLPSSSINTYINEEFISINERKLLKSEENILYISSISYGIGKKQFNYNISIEEGFSTVCNINVEIKSCYISCKNCSLSEDDSDNENHNCLSCKDNYYPFSKKETNCYAKEDANLDWYFDEDKNIFDICNSECKTCYGPNNDNCLSCPLNNDNNPLYLYNGKCILDCPIGTFISKNTEKIYICENCYINCKTCNESGTPLDMKCESCSEDKIIYRKECYEIYNYSNKTFYNPDNLSEITSCYELLNLYIKDDSNEYIPNIEEGYYISNNITGILSKCNSNCKTCSKNNSFCDSCYGNFYLQEGNCVFNCSSNYYLNGTICYKCHSNCLTCSSGEKLNNFGILISMECSQCLISNSMIKLEKNCFHIINYEETKITFNISELNEDNKIGTCYNYNRAIFYGSYECISKPENTFYVLTNSKNTRIIKNCDIACNSCIGDKNIHDTNCINCSLGYYKTEDSNTNCILESLIPDYYK